MIDLSIIIPTYNDHHVTGNSLRILIPYLKELNVFAEIIVIDDGSSSPFLYPEVKNQKQILRIIYSKKNMGKGAALRKGFLAASGRVQIFYDNDIPFGFEPLMKATNLILKNDTECVFGYRPNSLKSYDSVIRRIASYILNSFINPIFIQVQFDSQCGFKAFSKDAAYKIFKESSVNRFAIDIEIYYLIKKFKTSLVRIPVSYQTDFWSQKSSIKIVRDSLCTLKDMILIAPRWYLKQLKKLVRPVPLFSKIEEKVENSHLH